jgi:hypothetical protein
MFGRIQATALALIFVGCSSTKPPEKAVTTEPAKPIEYFHVDPATAGTLAGVVTFHGAKPANEKISMESDAACNQAHKGRPVYDDVVIVGKGGGLANAFVYIQSGLEGKVFEPVKEPATLDQHSCMFAPRVIGIRAAQPLDVKNSDPVSHNIHPMPKNNREWNDQQSPGTPDVEHKFARTDIMIPVKCNVHSWMHAWIGVVEHPYFAVTGANGKFDWSNVPPGDYTVAVWHEKLGSLTKQVHVPASGHVDADFSYE